MYYPEHFPFEWGHIHLNKVLDLFEINRKDLPEGVQSKRGSFYLKIGRLVDFKNNHPIMKEWSFYYLRAFLEEFDFGALVVDVIFIFKISLEKLF